MQCTGSAYTLRAEQVMNLVKYAPDLGAFRTGFEPTISRPMATLAAAGPGELHVVTERNIAEMGCVAWHQCGLPNFNKYQRSLLKDVSHVKNRWRIIIYLL